MDQPRDPREINALVHSTIGAMLAQFQDDYRRLRSNLADSIRTLADQIENLEPGDALPGGNILPFVPGEHDQPEQTAAQEDLEACGLTCDGEESASVAADDVEAPATPLPATAFLPDEREVSVEQGELVEQAAGSVEQPVSEEAPASALAPLEQATGVLLPATDLTLRLKSSRKHTMLCVDDGPQAAAVAEPKPSAVEFTRGHYEPVSPLSAHLFAEAQEQCRQGERSAALARFTEVIKLDPLLVPAYAERGQLLRLLGRHERALADFERACELDPDQAESYLRRGNVLCDLGRFDEAVADYGHAIERNPQQAVYYLNRGLAHAKAQDFAAAIADCDQALALDESLAKAYFVRGFALRSRHRPEEALADYTRLLELEPRNALGWNERGLVHAARRHYAEAVRDYVQALKLNPKLLLARYNRGLAYRLKGDYDLAIADFSEILRRKPKHHSAHVNRGICHLARGDYDRALSDFGAAHELAPDSQEIAKRLAEVRAALREQHRSRSKATLVLPAPPVEARAAPAPKQVAAQRVQAPARRLPSGADQFERLRGFVERVYEQRARAALAALLLVLGWAGWHFFKPSPRLLPSDLEERAELLGRAWLFKDADLVAQLTAPGQNGALKDWLGSNPVPETGWELSDFELAHRAQFRVDVAPSEERNFKQVCTRVIAPSGAGVDLKQCWVKQENGWFFAPKGLGGVAATD